MTRPALFLIVLGVSMARGGFAQAPRPVADARLVEVRVEPEQPRFGEAFDLHVTLRVRPAVVAFLPDTLLPADAVQSIGPGVWSQAPAPGDSVEIQATYPVIGFREGPVELPRIELGLRPAGAVPPGGGGVVRDAAGAGAEAGMETRVIRLGATVVGPFLPLADAGAEPVPRPPADVLGGEWSLWLLLAAGVTSIAGIGGAGVVVPRWWAAKGAALLARLRARSPRRDALRELERIRSSGWHRDGRIDDFYAASTDTLRGFAGRLEPAWGAALTSGELLAKMEERWGRRRVASLALAVAVAERVKFGAYRPDAEAAEVDWTTIRDWIRDAPEG